MTKQLTRLASEAALWLSMRRLEREERPRDAVKTWLFVGSFLTYWYVGRRIQSFHGHDAWNYFFNADCPRIVADVTESHRLASSGIAASSVHPLMLILLNPAGAALSTALGGADLFATLLLSHAAAAAANLFVYLALRRLSVERFLAAAAAVCLSLSTTQLVFGSITETYSFAGASLALSVLTALVSTRVDVAALVQLFPFGMNVILAPYSLLAVPVVWLGRLPARRWLARTAALWVLLPCLSLALLKLQHDRYPDTNFFHRSYFESYGAYAEKPADRARLFRRWRRLAPHLLAFDVVAPKPLFTGEPEKITTFMWEARNELSGYTRLGGLTVALWSAALATGTVLNLRGLFRGDRARLGARLLCAGWLLGVFGAFTIYGDDLMLFSELWAGIVVLWVGLGLSELTSRRAIAIRNACAVVFLVLMTWNNAAFLRTVMNRYVA